MNSANGIPLLGFGTWPLKDDDVERCVRMALEAGFRHIDTAQMYGNEKHVGRALKASGVARRDLYVVTRSAPAMWPPGPSGPRCKSRSKISADRSTSCSSTGHRPMP